jgi:xanthine dehydrogenase accessory factor
MNHWQKAQALEQAGTSFVVITLIATRGHAPQDEGAKAMVTRQGLAHGTVGGGKVEKRAIERGVELLGSRSKVTELVTWNLQRDIGMTCGGEVTFLFEVHRPADWSIAIFGAGHCSQALTRLLETVDCRVTCIDARPEWVSKLSPHPKLTALCMPQPAEWVSQAPADTYWVVMTQGHATDVPILEAIFRREPRPVYVGVIGSQTKGAVIRKELLEKGIPESSLSELRCPIGLKLGNNQPAEIAISIAAELLQVRGSALPGARAAGVENA